VDDQLLAIARTIERAVADTRQMVASQQDAAAQAAALTAQDTRLFGRSMEAVALSRSRLQASRRALDRNQELAHLVRAERHLAAARERIGRQRRLIDRLRQKNHPTAMAESLLQTMLATMAAMQAHRREILQQFGLPDGLPLHGSRSRPRLR
jgi:hypothetical protein